RLDDGVRTRSVTGLRHSWGKTAVRPRGGVDAVEWAAKRPVHGCSSGCHDAPAARRVGAERGRDGRRKELGEAMSPGLKKILIFGVVALVLFLLISRPTESADAVQTALSWLGDGAEALVTFVQSLFS